MADGAFRNFQRPEPVDVADTPFKPQKGLLDLLRPMKQGPQVQDPQAMGNDPFVFNGGGTATRESDLMWGEALASPLQRKVGEVLGGETGSRAMMLANFLGPAVKLPVPRMASSGTGGGLMQRLATVAPEPKGIRAYHGSPHDFEKFDMAKIGTGEGAQAYGHGLYFAEQEAVAKGYRDQLADYSKAIRWKGVEPPTPVQQSLLDRLGGPDSRGVPMTIDKLRRELQRNAMQQQMVMDGNVPFGRPMPEAKKWVDAARADIAEFEKIAPHIEVTQPGKMYEVNIKADPSDFLDWDAPLSKQSEKAVNALREGYKKSFGVSDRYLDDMMHPDANINSAIGAGRMSARMTDNLREQGIPGIKYKDAGSRGADGGGTSNFVVFDDSLIEILRKYGLIPPALAAGAVAAQDGGDKGNY